MRVVLVNRDHDLWEGGDHLKIDRYVRMLPRYGIEASYSAETSGDYMADLVHLFHISYPTAYRAFENVRRQRKRLVVSTIYSGASIPARRQQEIADYATDLLFQSKGELTYARRQIDIDSRKVHIVPNGVSARFDVPRRAHDYVLCVGRVQPQKNQLELAAACRHAKLPLRCVGQILDHDYARDVRSTGDCLLLGHVSQRELPDLYARAGIVACVSTHEVQPNSVFEAGIAGAKIVLTTSSCSFTEGLPGIWLCAPSRDSIRRALAQAWVAESEEPLRSLFRARTWERSIGQVVTIYRQSSNGDAAMGDDRKAVRRCG